MKEFDVFFMLLGGLAALCIAYYATPLFGTLIAICLALTAAFVIGYVGGIFRLNK